LEDDYFDLIVTLAPEAHHAALELTRSLAVEVEYWPTPDPTDAGGTREQIMAAYRDVRERLKVRIGRRFLLPEAKNATD
ncbi:protein-tyrosine-phosphatase, partial [Mesorhizobium sp. M7A.F.Ca.US.001.01.1.1]